MDHSAITALARMGYTQDSNHLKTWAEERGAFLINFGGIELVTYRYLVLLEPDPALLERHFEPLLSAGSANLSRRLSSTADTFGRREERPC